jgi:protein-S-isoprenylcysteine O-methyltransferase Ste14
MVDFNSLSSNQRFALNLLVPFLYLLPLLVAWFSPKNFAFGYSQMMGVSLATGMAGLLLWILAMFHLGKSLAVLPGSDSLVARGVYRYIRHPIYLGITLTLFGLLFACGSVFGMVYLVLVVIPLNLFRAQKEEQALAERFGDHYLEYRDKTWF